jgi:hypothetical protein
MGRDQTFDGDCLDLSLEVDLGLGLPGSVPCEHLVVDDSDGPDIAFGAVEIVVKSLERHVDWRSYVVVAGFLQICVFDGESKVCDFDFALVEKDVGRLEVSVNYSESVDSSISVDNFF